jgi:hypothetical protein
MVPLCVYRRGRCALTVCPSTPAGTVLHGAGCERRAWFAVRCSRFLRSFALFSTYRLVCLCSGTLYYTIQLRTGACAGESKQNEGRRRGIPRNRGLPSPAQIARCACCGECDMQTRMDQRSQEGMHIIDCQQCGSSVCILLCRFTSL